MDTEPVSSESQTKNGVATPPKQRAVAATPEQLAKQSKELIDLSQEWSVKGRETSSIIIRFCVAFNTFEQDATFAKNDGARRELEKRLAITPDQAKRYRSIAAVAKALVSIQHALPPTVESIYEVSKAFAPGKETDKRYVLDAVQDGLLTIKSSLEDIRNLRRDGQPAQPQRKARTAPASATPLSSGAMTDEQIVKQAKAQGINALDKQQEIVRQIRQADAAEAAKTTSRAVIEATPSGRLHTDEPERLFLPEEMVFSDIKVEGTTVTGRFTVTNVKKHHGKWPSSLPASLIDAISQAHL